MQQRTIHIAVNNTAHVTITQIQHGATEFTIAALAFVDVAVASAEPDPVTPCVPPVLVQPSPIPKKHPLGSRHCASIVLNTPWNSGTTLPLAT
jgi:hypothetical protein